MSSYKKEIRFTLNNIDGELKLIYTLFSTKVYQNDMLLPRENFFVPKYPVKASDGSIQKLRVSQGVDFIYKAESNESIKYLEDKHSLIEYMLSVLPIFIMFRGGIVGILLGVLGSYFNLRFMRLEQGRYVQIAAAIGVTALCFGMFYILSILTTSVLIK